MPPTRGGRLLSLVAMMAILSALPACTTGEGPVLDEPREVGAFTRIEAGSGIHVTVTIGPAGPLVVRAQADIASSIQTDVRAGTLRVEAIDDFVVAEPVVIEVTVPTLESITLSGGAETVVEVLHADAIDVDLSGGSHATISGAVEHLALAAKGGSIASLQALDATDVSVTLDGGASVELSASGTVVGTASGAATLTVAGDAAVEVETSGGATVSQ